MASSETRKRHLRRQRLHSSMIGSQSHGQDHMWHAVPLRNWTAVSNQLTVPLLFPFVSNSAPLRREIFSNFPTRASQNHYYFLQAIVQLTYVAYDTVQAFVKEKVLTGFPCSWTWFPRSFSGNRLFLYPLIRKWMPVGHWRVSHANLLRGNCTFCVSETLINTQSTKMKYELVEETFKYISTAIKPDSLTVNTVYCMRRSH